MITWNRCKFKYRNYNPSSEPFVESFIFKLELGHPVLLVIVLVFEGGRLGCSFVDRFTGGLIVCFVEFP